MSNQELLTRTESLIRRERELVECLIWMAALKIMQEVPEVTQALASGELNLTNLALAQSFFNKQEKTEPVSREDKAKLIHLIKNKNTREVKEFLADINPAEVLPSDQVKFLDPEHVQLLAVLSKNTLKKIEHLKALISHESLNPSYEELLSLALDTAIEKIEKKKGLHAMQEKNSQVSKTTSHTESHTNLTQSFAVRKFQRKNPKANSRYIPRSVKSAVSQRAQHQCEFKHADGTRSRCCTRARPVPLLKAQDDFQRCVVRALEAVQDFVCMHVDSAHENVIELKEARVVGKIHGHQV